MAQSETDVILSAIEAGRAKFLDAEFLVERGVLVPRPITEVMIRACLTVWQMGNPPTIVDVGCGSGIIGITLAKRMPGSRVICLDIEPASVALTQRNIELHNLHHRVSSLQSDMFSAVGNLIASADLVVCSPPFISTGRLEKDRASLLELEPRAAFDAGPYGIRIHQRLVQESKQILRPGASWLVVEVGHGQHNQVKRLLERAGGYDQITEFMESTGTYVACLAAHYRGETDA